MSKSFSGFLFGNTFRVIYTNHKVYNMMSYQKCFIILTICCIVVVVVVVVLLLLLLLMFWSPNGRYHGQVLVCFSIVLLHNMSAISVDIYSKHPAASWSKSHPYKIYNLQSILVWCLSFLVEPDMPGVGTWKNPPRFCTFPPFASLWNRLIPKKFLQATKPTRPLFDISWACFFAPLAVLFFGKWRFSSESPSPKDVTASGDWHPRRAKKLAGHWSGSSGWPASSWNIHTFGSWSWSEQWKKPGLVGLYRGWQTIQFI